MSNLSHMEKETAGAYLKVNHANFPSSYDFLKLRVALFEYIIAKEVEWSMNSNERNLSISDFKNTKITTSKLLLHPIIITFGNGSSESLFETINNFKYKYRFGIISTNILDIVLNEKHLFHFFDFENLNNISVKGNFKNDSISSILNKITNYVFDANHGYSLNLVSAKKNNSSEYGLLISAIDSSFDELKRKFYNLLDLDVDLLIKYFINIFHDVLLDEKEDNGLVKYNNIKNKIQFV